MNSTASQFLLSLPRAQRGWSANHALQRTAPCVTAPASAAAFPPTVQVPRRTPLSLSLRSLGVAPRFVSNHASLGVYREVSFFPGRTLWLTPASRLHRAQHFGVIQPLRLLRVSSFRFQLLHPSRQTGGFGLSSVPCAARTHPFGLS